MGAVDFDAVLFDLDDTLCEYRRSVDDVLDDAFDAAGVDPFFTAADFERWIPRVTADSPLDLRRKCFREIAEASGRDPTLGHRVAGAYEERDPSDVRFLPGAEAALDALSSRYRTGLVTNGGRPTQRPKLDALDVDHHFEVAVYATPERGIKPDPAPFDRVLDGLDVPADRAVHVGNSVASDVAGARAAGVSSVLVGDATGATDPTPDYVIESMEELVRPPWEADR